MKPRPPDDPDAPARRLREQLILAQVRIMELEDERDDITARQAETERLLQDTQKLADQKMEALAHLEKVHADLEAQFVHLRHMQHVTNEALNDTRAQLKETADRLAASEHEHRLAREQIASLEQTVAAGRAQAAELREQASRLGAQIETLDARVRQLDAELAAVNATATARLQRITELDGELHAMKASRSWRWTRPLRALERFARRRRR